MIDREFEQRERPEIPLEYCTSWVAREMGIISPSLRMAHFNLEFELAVLKYRVYNRNASRENWKDLYRYVRNQRRNGNGREVD